ncbi:hypothetical protein C1645_846278 [Glomus cerebriforme]|uniref:F-box domain-containing protein n=1 Tax=Glomus cerebriforme TaxID=658196 RepID=A0A397T7L9_9GLOM|nr:hypothetical protein C1645_846278 [Glomus cerebriforme]
MPFQLPVDCLNEIFECLEEDRITLHSCLLINRLWCKTSVRILWRNCLKFNNRQRLKILDTLMACLPKESKDLLYENKIFITTSTSKQPLFNYPSFYKVLSISEIVIMIKLFLSEYLKKEIDLLKHEILKMFMKQIPSLKKLIYYSVENRILKNITLTHFSETKVCLTNLSELKCSSNINSDFFYQLSEICQNIQTLDIEFGCTISNGLIEMISSQDKLKHLSLTDIWSDIDWTGIIPSLINHSNTITKLHILGYRNKELSFITNFTNLQELFISFMQDGSCIKYFKELQYVTFNHLNNLKFDGGCPKFEILVKFLENNGKNLKEFYVNGYGSLNLIIAKFCPNLRSLYTLFPENEMETLKVIFNSCQQLESLKVLCGNRYLKESKVLKIVAKHSPENFHELKLRNFGISELDLESFFISWKNRVPQRSISFIIEGFIFIKREHIDIFEKYKKLGIVKKFEIIN